MANKRISELNTRVPATSDLMLVGDPTTGYSYKCTIAQAIGLGVASFNGRTGAVNPAEGDYSLNLLSDVVVTAPSNGQVLQYNGTSWVNQALQGFVPYTGATANVTLGEYGLKAGWFGFDLTPTGTPTDQGTMYWDDSRSTVALIMNGTLQHIGQDQFYYVKNSTGTSIPKGTAVGFAGTDGGSGHLLIKPFRANGVEPSTYFMGVTSEAIGNGAFGQVMSFGEMRGVDTSAFADGDILYVSTATAGAFQTTVPSAPNNIIQVAAVVNAANNGTIIVRPTLGSKLTLDESVSITTPSNGQVLQYNSSTGLWQNATISTTNIYTANGTLTGNRTLTSGGFSLTFTGAVNLASAGGNVGIGTTSPGEKLTVVGSSGVGKATTNSVAYSAVYNGSTGFIALQQRDGTSARYGVNGMSELTSSSTGGLAIVSASGAVHLGTSTNEMMRLFTTGNVLIQTGGTFTDAGFKLDVNGTARFSSDITVNGIRVGVGGGNSNTNVRVGDAALNSNTTGTSNTAIGSNALQNNTTGVENVAVGRLTSFSNISGSNTTVIGSTAMYSVQSGNANVALGQNAGRYAGTGSSTPITSVDQSIYIGVQSRGLNATGTTNEIVIGYNVVGLGSNTTALGNSSTTFGRWYGSLLVGTSTDVASSILTLESTTRGFLMPRMTTTQRDAITSPATGLQVYNTSTNQPNYYNGSAWAALADTNIYNTNGTLTAERTITDGGFATKFTGTMFLALSTGYVVVGATGDTSYKLSVDGDLRVYGNIRTAQPTGGTATGVWRLGSTATGTFTMSTTVCVEVEIGGTLYKLATVS